MKVTVLPAGHPLLRGLNPDQQIVIRPGGTNTGQQVIVRPQQQLVVRQQQPGVQQQQQLVIRPHQQAVLRPQQNGTQQIFIRPGVQQPLVVRPANNLANNLGTNVANNLASPQQGQIRLTAQQLASLTSQQIVIRPSQNGTQQQILITRPASSVNSVKAVSGSPQFTKVVGSPIGGTSLQLNRPQVPSTGITQVSGVQFSGVQTQGKSVVTYLRQVKPDQPGNVNLQNIRLSGQNVRFSVASTAASSPVTLKPTPSPQAPQQSSVIRLGTRAVAPGGQINLTQTARQAAPSNATIVSSSFQLSVPSANGPTVQRQLRPNIVRNASKMIAPRIVQSAAGVVKSDIQGVPSNNIVYKQGGSGGVSLLTQGRGEARMQDAASKEGLHLITADGKFINTEGLHLITADGKFI